MNPVLSLHFSVVGKLVITGNGKFCIANRNYSPKSLATVVNKSTEIQQTFLQSSFKHGQIVLTASQITELFECEKGKKDTLASKIVERNCRWPL